MQREEVENEEEDFSAEKFLSQNSKSILEICFSSILACKRKGASLFLLQYTFKSVIATSKEIDLESVERCHQNVHAPPASLHLYYFAPLIHY